MGEANGNWAGTEVGSQQSVVGKSRAPRAFPSVMLLAQCGKPRGSGGGAPRGQATAVGYVSHTISQPDSD
jgi:hypothetical protein